MDWQSSPRLSDFSVALSDVFYVARQPAPPSSSTQQTGRAEPPPPCASSTERRGKHRTVPAGEGGRSGRSRAPPLAGAPCSPLTMMPFSVGIESKPVYVQEQDTFPKHHGSYRQRRGEILEPTCSWLPLYVHRAHAHRPAAGLCEASGDAQRSVTAPLRSFALKHMVRFLALKEPCGEVRGCSEWPFRGTSGQSASTFG